MEDIHKNRKMEQTEKLFPCSSLVAYIISNSLYFRASLLSNFYFTVTVCVEEALTKDEAGERQCLWLLDAGGVEEASYLPD